MSNLMNHFLAVMCGLMIIWIGIFLTIDILMSFLFNTHIPGTIEIVTLILPWAICLGLAYGLIRGAHVRVSLLIDKFSNKKRLWTDTLAFILGFLFFCALTYGSWLNFWSSWVVKEYAAAALMSIPWWLAKLALPVGMFLIGIQFLIECFSNFIKE